MTIAMRSHLVNRVVPWLALVAPLASAGQISQRPGAGVDLPEERAEISRSGGTHVGCEVGFGSHSAVQSPSPAGPRAGTPESLAPFRVIMDSLIGPEDYGFFYALAHDYYGSAGLWVHISPGFGSQATADDFQSGTIYAGTSTSENVFRIWNKGCRFSHVVPLVRFNPVVIASTGPRRIKKLNDLRSKNLGVHDMSAAYPQWTHLRARAGLNEDAMSEVGVAFSGVKMLREVSVDALLARTTDASVELELAGVDFDELWVQDLEVRSFGKVLIVGSEEALTKHGLTKDQARAFVAASSRGYAEGAKDVDGSVEAMLKIWPKLDRAWLKRAITKLSELNEKRSFPMADLDAWAMPKSLSPEKRKEYLALYEAK